MTKYVISKTREQYKYKLFDKQEVKFTSISYDNKIALLNAIGAFKSNIVCKYIDQVKNDPSIYIKAQNGQILGHTNETQEYLNKLIELSKTEIIEDTTENIELTKHHETNTNRDKKQIEEDIYHTKQKLKELEKELYNQPKFTLMFNMCKGKHTIVAQPTHQVVNLKANGWIVWTEKDAHSFLNFVFNNKI